MMKKITLVMVAMIFALGSYAQKIDTEKGSFMINAGMDVYRVPRAKFFEGNINPSLDFDYFFANNFAGTFGLNYNAGARATGIEPGLRFYPAGALFLRTRAHMPINLNAIDMSFGIGYDFMASDMLAVEVNIDRTVDTKVTSMRLGVAIFL